MKLTMWRVVVVLNMHTKFRETKSPSTFLIATMLCKKDEGDFFPRNVVCMHIKDNKNSPHGKFHRFLFPLIF